MGDDRGLDEQARRRARALAAVAFAESLPDVWEEGELEEYREGLDKWEALGRYVRPEKYVAMMKARQGGRE